VTSVQFTFGVPDPLKHVKVNKSPCVQATRMNTFEGTASWKEFQHFSSAHCRGNHCVLATDTGQRRTRISCAKPPARSYTMRRLSLVRHLLIDFYGRFPPGQGLKYIDPFLISKHGDVSFCGRSFL